MTDNQPHIHELGAFDPGMAFGRTFFSGAQLVEGHKEAPDTLPLGEVLRAAQVALDTLETIAEIAHESLAQQVRAAVGDEAWNDWRLEQEALRHSHSPEEEALRRMKLLHKLSEYTIPHEVDLDTPGD